MTPRYSYITVLPFQSIMDICLMSYGSLEALPWLLEDNPTALATENPEGMKLLIRPRYHDLTIVTYFKNSILVTL